MYSHKPWQSKRLGDVAHVKASNVDKIISQDEIPVRLCNYMDVYNNDYIDSNISLSEGSVLPRQLEEYRLKKGQVLITKDSETPEDIAKSAYVTQDFDEVVCGYHLAIITPKDEIDGRFLKRIFDVPVYQYYFSRLSNGVTRFGITQPSIKSAWIQYPEKDEQIKIVHVLDAWDAYVKKIESKIVLKKEVKRSLSRRLLNGAHRINGYTDNWREAKVEEFAKESRIKDSGNPNKRLTVRLHLKGIDARVVRGTEVLGSTQFYTRSAGQLIYGKQNIFKGAIGIVPEIYDGYSSSQDIPSFDIDSNKADVRFIFYILSRKQFYEWLESFAGGSGSKRFHTSEFYKIKINLPSLNEQSAIADILDIAEAEIDELIRLKQKITEQRNYLLENLMTGTVKVPETMKVRGAN